MFLSSTDEGSPNNPSSSSSFLHLTNSSHALGQSHLSSFSIRDYAFSYRTKNIQKSWPFSSTSLQLCLKHGLTDPLPPFQPLGSEAKLKVIHVEARMLEKLGSNHALAETEQGFLASGSKSKVQVAIVNKNPRKKCGLVVKHGACVNSVSKQAQGSLFSTSESMGFRACPICKTFSSASNTTLNAHMDQCLSVDSDQQPMSKHRNKPRLKVKTLVDIYATAKRSTLEELDKRNGTKWSVVLSYSNQVVSDNKPEVSNKVKKRSVLRVGNDEDDGIGPVYIDAEGQKLRILSDSPRKHVEDVSEKKSSNKGQGKRLRFKKHYKHCKVVPQSRKLTVREGNASEIPEYQRGYSEEYRAMERSETPGPSQRRILNQRMVTRSCLSRNENKKGRSISDSLSADPLVLRGPRHASVDLSETVSTCFRSQNSWRSCGESQVSRKSTKSPLRCSMPVDKVFASAPKGFLKLKKARLDFSENEDEDSGRWESEMTQERELTDYDDNEETDKVFLSSDPSVGSGEENDYEGWEVTGDNKVDDDDDMLYQTNDAEFESSFMEVDLIPIPGPPGSFLPSPWDMETDATENHVNSSVTTSQFQSSHDQLDLTDRKSSESPETQTFRDNDQSCCCQRKENVFEDTTFGKPAPHMNQQDLDLSSKSVSKTPSVSNPVLRLMGKDLMVINQIEDTSHGDSSLIPTSQFHDLSKTKQVFPPVHLLHGPYGADSSYLDSTTSFYNIP
ncbi:hypothetical protein BRARA_B01281 [Brassica rapa]|uniref:UBZ4-type domain-containing protein n=2 Tax=Brassica campestris TaxID=3711 RepID=A0A398AET3_BRACM|nr:hypothetical protein IGI04_005505 [Brassica rapa subsp. trilocularis]RID74170.1 hypothetical protein BRARA_B01281 [Brassica rapa]RID74171.1 hypothetical protein BRARA_B01281 [Brassica rapa]RID74172.1 hypothetical protein BRARA_B01281 [Brassica rapa]